MQKDHLTPLTSNCNTPQKQAILFDHSQGGPLFVLAGAGSGKTFVLTSRIVYLVLQGVPAKYITALTFTQAAAEEMTQRATGKLQEFGYRGPSLPQASTFHSLAYKIIRQEVQGLPNWQRLGFSKPPGLLPEKAKKQFIQKVRKQLGVAEGPDQISEWISSPFFASVEAESSGQPSREASDEMSSRKMIVNMFNRYLMDQNALTFGDMVSLAVRLLRDFPEVQKECQKRCIHLLVDEFQDTSPDQFHLIRLLAAPEENLFVVGDDDQAIYGFRGADNRCIQNLFQAYPALSNVRLQLNYRSTRSILKYANTIFRDKPPRMRKRLYPARLSQSPLFTRNQKVTVRIHATSLKEGRYLAREIQRLRRQEGLAWEDFAFLYRLNRQAEYYRHLIRHVFGEEAVKSIRFSTVHSAKGLQYPVVFLVGLEQGVLPYHGSTGALSKQRYAEEKRLFYVGVTRAENLLYLCHSKKRMVGGKMRSFNISPFLLESGSLWERLKIRFWNRMYS